MRPLVQPHTAERGASGRSPEGTAMLAASSHEHIARWAGSGAAQRSARNTRSHSRTNKKMRKLSIRTRLALLVLMFGPTTMLAHLSDHQLEGTGWVCWLLAGWTIVSWLWRKQTPDSALSFAFTTSGMLAIVSGSMLFSLVPRLLPREKLRPFVAKIVASTGPTDR